MHSWIWTRLEDFLMNRTQSHIVILVVYKRADSDTGDHIKYSTTHQLTFSAHTSVAQHFRRWYLLHQFFRRIRSHLVLHTRRRQETYNNVALVYRKKTIFFKKLKIFLTQLRWGNSLVILTFVNCKYLNCINYGFYLVRTTLNRKFFREFLYCIKMIKI